MAYQLGGALSGLYDPDDLEPLTTPFGRLRMGLASPRDLPFPELAEKLALKDALTTYHNLSQDEEGQGTRRVTNELVDQVLRARNARSINQTRGGDTLRSPEQVAEATREPSFTERLLMDYLPQGAMFAADVMRPQIYSDYMNAAEKNWNEGNYGSSAAYLALAPVGAFADVASIAILPAAVEKSLAAGAARALSRAGRKADDVLGGSNMAAGAGLAAGGAAMLPKTAEAGPPKWYSVLERAIENAPQSKATLDQWMGYLRNRPGVKPEEIEYTLGSKAKNGGILDLDIGSQSVTRAELLKEFSPVPVQELYHGNPLTRSERSRIRELDEAENPFTDKFKPQTPEETDEHYRLIGKRDKAGAGKPKYEDRPGTRLPGESSDYREIVVTSPRAQPDASISPSHFGPQGRAPDATKRSQQIGWIRGDVRKLDDGSRAFHVDEFQSDPAQRALKKGWNRGKQSDEITQIELRADQNRWVFTDALNDPTHPGHADALRHQELERQGHKANHSGVPDRPWKKDWPKLLFRRALWEAAQEDADHLTWTPAEIQQERWGGARLGRDRVYDEVIPKIAADEAKRLGLPKEAVGEARAPGQSKWNNEVEEQLMGRIPPDGDPREVANELYEFLKERGVDMNRWAGAVREIEQASPDSAGFEAMFLAEKILSGEVSTDGKTRLYSLKLTPEVRKKILSEGLPTFVGAGIAPGLVERFLSDE